MFEREEVSVLRGVVRGIRFRNEENGYTVLDIECGDAAEESDAFSLLPPEAHTAVGNLPSIAPGETLELHGVWVEHHEYGPQFKFSRGVPVMPESVDGIEKYLGSGLIDGIGPATAKNIVRAFGDDALRIMEQQPELLATVKGIGRRRAVTIAESFAEKSAARSTVIALQGLGISTGQAVKLFQSYGPDAYALIYENPYRLIEEVEGIGFARADQIAQACGLAENAPERQRAALFYVLQRAQQDGGHTCYPFRKCCEEAAQLLHFDGTEAIEAVLTDMTIEKRVVTQFIGETEMIFLPWLCQQEQACARALLERKRQPVNVDRVRLEQQLAALERESGLQLDEEQRRAVLMAFENGVFVITGGPGTGKTTILNFILRLMEKLEWDTLLCAPTGRAAKRLSEATGAEAATIHRLLGYSGERFECDDSNPLECDALIADEMSMVDVWLFYHLLNAVPPGARLILVGDVDQLPSVGAGNVLGDIIASGALPVVRLTQVFRQGVRSRIIENAHRINAGDMPLLDYTDDFAFQQIGAPNDILRRVVGICAAGKLGDPWTQVQVMAPSKKGILGVTSLNAALQSTLNPPQRDRKEVTNGDRVFRVGDKIMQIKNNYKVEWTRPGLNFGQAGTGVYNGDMGTLMNVYPDDRTVELLFDDERTAFYEFKMLEQIDLAYAISIHKSQGSEFPIVLMPLVDGPPMLYTRNLLYTAVTRARHRVVIIGRQSAIAFMVQNAHERERYSNLCETLTRLNPLFEGNYEEREERVEAE